MRIPSYDDLTPSIPDISPGELFSAVARLVPTAATTANSQPPISNSQISQSKVGSLFGCLCSARVWETIVQIAQDFSPRIQRYGADAVVLDISGLGRLLGSPDAIGAELARAAGAHRTDIRVAVAPTQTAALLLSRSHSALAVVTADAAAAVASLPLSALHQVAAIVQPSVAQADDEVFDVLRRWGLKRIGEFAALPSADLSARLGQRGIALQQLAHAVDPHPLVPHPGVRRFVERMELEWPIDALEPLSFVFARLLDPLASALERGDRAAASIRLQLRLVDRTVHERMLQLPAAIRDARVLRTLLLLDLEAHPPPAAVDVVTIEADPAPSRIVQYSLLERATPSAETLATLNARLYALVGEARCGSPELLDSHRPDAFVMRRFPPSPLRGFGAAGPSPLRGFGAAGSSPLRGFGAAGPSPLRGFGTAGAERPASTSDPPTPSAQRPASAVARSESARASAFAPDNAPQATADRSAGEPSLRRFRPPVAVRVALDRRRPVHVAIDRRGMPGGAVVQAAGPWRSSGAWWDRDRQAWDRDEWDVEFADGVICRLFHDRGTGVWFLDGIVD